MLPARPNVQPTWVTRRSPRTWLIAMTLIGATGVPLAALRAGLSYPTGLTSLSRLGLDARGGLILNATLVGLGLSLMALAISLRGAFEQLRRDRGLAGHPELLVLGGLIVPAAGFGVTGIFTIQTPSSTIVHNIAAFATPIVLIGTLLGARVALKGLGWEFDVASVSIAASAATLYAASSAIRVIPWAVMEAACFAMIGMWLWLFEARIRALTSRGHAAE
jgi:hypothetical protein